MPAVGETLQVEGLADLQRAFQLADRQLTRDLRSRLREAAEPVREDAERLAASTIPRIGIPWSRMRVGVTRHTVYVAPRERGARGGPRSRRNLATMLLNRSMIPAVRQNAPQVVTAVDDLLIDIGRTWEQA